LNRRSSGAPSRSSSNPYGRVRPGDVQSSPAARGRARYPQGAGAHAHAGTRTAPAGPGRVVGIVVLAALAALVAFSLYTVWNTWFRYDDAADFQGTWTSSEGATVTIDGSQIRLSDDVAYSYTLDTQAKTITFTFGTSEGHASYRFNENRTRIVLDEDAGTDWPVVLHLQKDDVLDAASDEVPSGVTVLARSGD
jgi:hypothetical protein